MTEVALRRAEAALASPELDVDPGSPYAATLARARGAMGLEAREASVAPLFERWRRVHLGSEIGELRYRFPLTHRRVRPLPEWAGAPESWSPWRPAEAPLVEDPFEFEARLSVPAVLADVTELLSELSDAGGELGAEAQAMLFEAEPVLRRDFASFVRAANAWADTFALWCISRRPRALAILQPFALAIATSYAANAARAGGVVLGTRFPFHEQPLVSASAQLATGLLALGQELELAARLSAWVAGAASAEGGWADLAGPVDPLTTVAAADLLSHVDPSFDADPAVARLTELQRAGGWWRVYGPEVPWLTSVIADWLRAVERPFSDRFRWPHLPDANRDHKTRLPFFAWFEQLARLFRALPGLAGAHTEIAFIDLAGFRAFNNRHGQDRGDDALRAFAEELERIPAASAIRDGGDEFLVVGAPTGRTLGEKLDALRRAWPDVFRRRFGAEVAPVAPRILVASSRGGALRATREVLGREIGRLKEAARELPPEGVLRQLP